MVVSSNCFPLAFFKGQLTINPNLTFEPNNPNPKLMDFFKILKINFINKVRRGLQVKAFGFETTRCGSEMENHHQLNFCFEHQPLKITRFWRIGPRYHASLTIKKLVQHCKGGKDCMASPCTMRVSVFYLGNCRYEKWWANQPFWSVVAFGDYE